MIFEKEINIFKKGDFATRFHEINTQFQVQKGKISSIVSDSEFEQLGDEKLTLYSKVSKVEQTAEEIRLSVKGIDSRMTEIKQTADKINLLVSSSDSESSFAMTDKAIEIITGSMKIGTKNGSAVIIKDGKIDLDELFAQNIKATGTIEGVNLKGATGSFSGDVKASSFSIQNSVISIQNREIESTSYDFDTNTKTFINYSFVEISKAFSMDTDCIIDAPKGISTTNVYSNKILANEQVSGPRGIFNDVAAYNFYWNTTDASGNYTVITLDDFRNSINTINQKISDTGWQAADLSAGYFASYSENSNKLRYRRNGKTVFIHGIATLKDNVTIEGGTSENTIFTLPEGYRPSMIVHTLCQGSSASKWLLTVRTDGSVNFSRYSKGTDFIDVSGKVWLPISVMFLVD